MNVTIETRPDYRLQPHPLSMLRYGTAARGWRSAGVQSLNCTRTWPATPTAAPGGGRVLHPSIPVPLSDTTNTIRRGGGRIVTRHHTIQKRVWTIPARHPTTHTIRKGVRIIQTPHHTHDPKTRQDNTGHPTLHLRKNLDKPDTTHHPGRVCSQGLGELILLSR